MNFDISSLILLKQFNNYFIVYFAIAISGVLLLMGNIYLILFFLYLLLFSLTKKLPRQLLYKYLLTITTVVVITLLQFSYFDVFIVNSFLSIILVFTLCFLLNIVLKERFLLVFIQLVYFFSIVSLIFYSVGLVAPSVYYYLGSLSDLLEIDPYYTKNLLLFNFVENHAQVFGINVLRNNGFLYEPGMFACVLIPALAFNTIINNEFYNNKNTVFIIAIITTFSTAAYLALAAYLIIYYVVCNGLTFLKTVIAVFVAAILGITIWQLEFIGEKIESQFDSALYGDYSQRHFGRIGSALVDIEEIREFPLIGRGRNQETRFDRSELLYNPHFAHRTNGLFDLMAAMGIPFFILYMFLLYRSINNFCLAQEWSKYAWMLFFIPFLIMASSQTILFRPLFLAFLFIYPNQLND